jgi:hypothetical protein
VFTSWLGKHSFPKPGWRLNVTSFRHADYFFTGNFWVFYVLKNMTAKQKVNLLVFEWQVLGVSLYKILSGWYFQIHPTLTILGRVFVNQNGSIFVRVSATPKINDKIVWFVP